MKVAAAQMAPKFKAPGENVVTLIGLIQEAHSKGAELVVLPELATSGYSFMSSVDIAPYAEDLLNDASPTFNKFQELSKKLNIAIAWGMPVKENGLYYNSQILVLPNGSWFNYHKINPWGNDFLWATPGKNSPPIVQYNGKSVGLLICRDVRDKSSEIDSFYEQGEAEIICFSSNFGRGGFPATAWMDFADKNKSWLIVSNRYGVEAHNDFGHGGICIIEPSGKVHCDGLQWEKPCLVYANVP